MRDRALICSEFLETDLIVISEKGIPCQQARADIRNQRLILEALLDLRDIALGHKVKPKRKVTRLNGRKSGMGDMAFGRQARKPSAATEAAKPDGDGHED